MIKGFFFDLDGTLVDTHQANFQAYQWALFELGIEITFADFKKTIGQQARDFLPKLAPGLNKQHYAEVAKRKAEHYKNLMHLSAANDPLVAFLGWATRHHTTALVTTAKRKNLSTVLEHHGLVDHFDHIIGAEDVAQSKPAPDAYQLALARTKLKPHEVLVFEDSESGIQAAKAAGIKSIVTVKDFIV